MRRNVRFRLHVHILCPVEARRTAWSNTICSQCLYCLLLQRLVSHQVVEIVRGHIGDHAPGGELRLGPGRTVTDRSIRFLSPTVVTRDVIPNNHRPSFILGFFERGLWRDQRFWNPFIDDFINLLPNVSVTPEPEWSVDEPLQSTSHGDPLMSSI